MIFCFKHIELGISKTHLYLTYNESKAVYEISGIDPFGGNSMFNFQLRSIEDVEEFIQRNFLFRGYQQESVE